MSIIKRLVASRRNKVLASITTGVMMVAGGAFAYEAASAATASGSVTSVTQPAPATITGPYVDISNGPLSPAGAANFGYDGASYETLQFYVDNPNTQTAHGMTVTVKHDSTNNVEDAAGNAYSGCQANWFDARIVTNTNGGNPVSPLTDAPSGNSTVTVQVNMIDENQIQNTCSGVSPAIILTVPGVQIG